jgi:hypothetical protein
VFGLRAEAADPVPRAGDHDPIVALLAVWPGEYDITEETVIATNERRARIGAEASRRVQVLVRRVELAWLGQHVLYVEEYPLDDPLTLRREVLLALERAGPDQGDVRVRQFTRVAREAAANSASPLTSADLATDPGCDLWLQREGQQFRGGTRGSDCRVGGGNARYIDYQLVVGEGLFWYRQRTVDKELDEVLEEIAAFRQVDLEEARLFTCRVRWSRDGTRRQQRDLTALDLHDQGGRARFGTPDGRELELELHGRGWPASSPRASLVLFVHALPVTGEPLASGWTALDAGYIGVDLGWLAVDCRPVVGATDETRS